jgi:hypothetical protein
VPTSNLENSNQVKHHQPAAETQRNAPPVVAQTDSSADELVRQLKAENERLKRELMSFDLNFFEELEDLKFENQRYNAFTGNSLTAIDVKLS